MKRLDTVDPVIPISRVIRKYDKIIDQTRNALNKTPRWQFKRRWVLAAVISAYEFETNALLRLAASTQPVLRDILKQDR